MGFEKTESAKLYTAIDGDTLQAIAERETAAGNPITWQELAKYNWGTDDPATINELLRDELGARKRDGANNFTISADDTPRSELRIPKKFEKPALPLEKTHILRVRKKTICPQFQACSSIPGATFETDKSFLRPSVVDSIESIENAILENPDAKIMIFGHTDKVGSDSYNKALSERRAKSVYAFITDDAETWEELYKEEDWGTKAVQEILKDFDDPAFDPGPVDGIYGQKTREAVRNFQEARGLSVDGIAGPNTRKQLFSDYMTGKHDVKVTPDQFMEPKYMGCGEFNPVVPTEEATEVNRRVVFFLFHPERLPHLPCAFGAATSCSNQSIADQPRHHEGFRCSFYDSLACRCPAEMKYEVKALHLFGRPTLYNDRPEEATNIIIPKDWEVTLHWEVENAKEVVIEAQYIDSADNVERIPMPNGGRTPTSVGKCTGEVTHKPPSDVVYWLSAYKGGKHSDYYGSVKVTCMATKNSPDKRPVYIIGHRCNDPEDIGIAISKGCNAIECDLQYNNDIKEIFVNHDTARERVVLESNTTLKEWSNEAKKIIKQYPDQFSLIIFDCKFATEDDFNTANVLFDARKIIRDHITDGEDDKINIVFSIAKYKNKKGFDKITNNLNKNEGISIDEEDDPVEIEKFFTEKKVKNCWYGDGIASFLSGTGGTPIPIIGPIIDVFVPERDIYPPIKSGCKLRDKNERLKKVYVWTLASEDSIREYIEQANVDGVFVNVPGTLPYVPGTFGLDEALKVIKESRTARLANRKDPAFTVYKG